MSAIKSAAVDPTNLQPRERFDREYLLAIVDKDLFWIEKTQFPFSNPAWYLGQIDPDVYLSRNYAPLEVRMKAYIKYAQGIPRIAAAIKENLKSPMPKTYVELGIDEFGGLADFYTKNVTAVFAAVSDPDLQKQLKDADTAAAQAMSGLKDYLVGERKNATDKYAFGPDLFAQMVKQTEQVDLPVDQIEAAGRADLDRNTAALKAECEHLRAQGIAWRNASQKWRRTSPKADPSRKRAINSRCSRNSSSRTTSCRFRATTKPWWRRRRRTIAPMPHSSIPPGPTTRAWCPSITSRRRIRSGARPSRPPISPAKPRLLFTSVHEVWPGHFLQFLHSNANPDKLEGLWVGYAFAEGWAHYCEEMMVDMGLAKGDPEKHIGQLSEALLRDVRLLSAIGLHTHGMTVAQSEKMFREQAFQDPGNARQQAARGTYDPAYLNYTLGKLMIRKLRADWLAKSASGAAPANADDQPGGMNFTTNSCPTAARRSRLLRKELLGEGGSLL